MLYYSAKYLILHALTTHIGCVARMKGTKTTPHHDVCTNAQQTCTFCIYAHSHASLHCIAHCCTILHNTTSSTSLHNHRATHYSSNKNLSDGITLYILLRSTKCFTSQNLSAKLNASKATSNRPKAT